MPYTYETDGAAIYAESFATIRAEADLARFAPDEEQVAVRMIHAAGMVGLEAHVRFSPGMVAHGPRGARGRRAHLLRRAHGVRGRHTQTPARRQ
jgi:precorrin-8X/cobalt-precorrin-8 methylmutase